MKKILMVSSTRADYGLLYPVIKKFREKENQEFEFLLAVTGTHLSEDYGYTVKEIEKDEIRVDYRIECPVASKTEIDIAENISITIQKFTELFVNVKPDAVMILGDRYEILGVVIASLISKIPVFHIAGGDTTEGAIDESIRHSITKMSYLHFTTNPEAQKRVIQMGEAPERVYNVGSTSVDNILNDTLLTKEEALASIGLADCKYVLCTYHPVTLEKSSSLKEIEQLIDVLRKLDCEVIITKSNADLGGGSINQYLDEVAEKYKNIHVYTSLGRHRYLSVMKYAECVIGNSSSGIVETPVFHIPTVNIGNRQKGRFRSDSVIDASLTDGKLEDVISYAMSEEGKERARNAANPYGDGHAAERIVKISLNTINEEIDMQKQFIDSNIWNSVTR